MISDCLQGKETQHYKSFWSMKTRVVKLVRNLVIVSAPYDCQISPLYQTEETLIYTASSSLFSPPASAQRCPLPPSWGAWPWCAWSTYRWGAWGRRRNWCPAWWRWRSGKSGWRGARGRRWSWRGLQPKGELVPESIVVCEREWSAQGEAWPMLYLSICTSHCWILD